MYVCVCNALRESQVRNVVKESEESRALTVEQVYTRLGRDLRCGRCVLHVNELITTTREQHAEMKVT